MAKIYRTTLTHFQKSLNYGNSISESDVEQMLNVVFEEGDIMNEDDNEEVIEPESNEKEVTNNTNEILGIEQVIDLGPWVFIDNTVLPSITRRFDDSEDDDDWDPEALANNSNN